MASLPYYSHIFRDFYGSGMGIVREAYHTGVPVLASLKILTDFWDGETPLHKPYPCSLYRLGILHFRYLQCLVTIWDLITIIILIMPGGPVHIQD